MNISLAAKRLSEFFGLSDRQENSDESNSQLENDYFKKTETRDDNYTSSYFPLEEKAETNRSKELEREHENVRIPNKVVQMKKEQEEPSQKVKGDDTVRKITIVEPRTYTEAKNIAQSIFRDETVIINFQLVEEMQARRIVDFLTGTVYALDGDIQRLGDEIFICTPANMEIDSTTAKSLLNSQFPDY